LREGKVERIWQKNYDEGVSGSLDYPECSLYQLFQQAVDKEPARLATLFFGAGITYGKLGKLVDRFAAGLASLGVQQGDRIALILPNIPLYPIAHFAVLKLGGILVPTNPLYVERELEYQLNNSGAETAIVFDKLYPRLASVRNRTSVKRIVVSGVQDFLPKALALLYKLKNRPQPIRGKDVHSYSDLIKMGKAGVEPSPVEPDETAIFLYTGGTTGISKGAVLTHRNLVVNVLQTRIWLREIRDGQDTILCALPFFHSYGLTTGLHLSIQSQATMVLLPRFDLKEALKRIKKHRPTVFCGVPSMYNAINHAPGLKAEDVGSIRLCVSGGAALPADVQTTFEALTGAKLVEGYGLSETSPVAIVNPVFAHRKSGSIGIPISDTEARIIDPDSSQELPVGEVGEVAIRGPQVMKEYWNMPDETRQVLKGEWLHTGDLGRMDEDGFFSIVDRKKDIIVSAGFNVYPREIEEVLTHHPKIVEAAVLGVPSKVREEVVKAYIVVKEGEELTKAEVMQYCREHLSKFKMPKKIEFRQELPKSSVGKILKRILKKEAS
jgi:long-chain acyl-CoA synthetase